MPSYELVVQVLKDGLNIGGFPFRRTLEVNEGSEFNIVKSGSDVTPQPFPGLIAATNLQLFVASSDQPVTLVPGGSAAGDGEIELLAGGLVLLFNVSQGAPAGNTIQIENDGATAANVKGAWGSS